MTIRDGNITFNTACINGLENVVYVRFEINEDLKRLVIKPCDENDKHAVRWCVAKPDKRKTRYIKCPDVTDKIFALMGWDKKYRYKILAFMIAPEGENFYIFDLLISVFFYFFYVITQWEFFFDLLRSRYRSQEFHLHFHYYFSP